MQQTPQAGGLQRVAQVLQIGGEDVRGAGNGLFVPARLVVSVKVHAAAVVGGKEVGVDVHGQGHGGVGGQHGEEAALGR